MMIIIICIVNSFSHNDAVMKSQIMSLSLLVHLQKVEYRGRSVFCFVLFFWAAGHKYKNSQYSNFWRWTSIHLKFLKWFSKDRHWCHFTWQLVSERCNTLGNAMPVNAGRDIGVQLVSLSLWQRKLQIHEWNTVCVSCHAERDNNKQG